MKTMEAECNSGPLFNKHQGKSSTGILGYINSWEELLLRQTLKQHHNQDSVVRGTFALLSNQALLTPKGKAVKNRK